jgi:hypothetical protein
MPDIDAVLAEIQRILRPGGLLVEASWGSNGTNRAFDAVLGELAKSAGTLHAFEGILDESTWADTRSATTLLRDAGFVDVRVLIEPLRGVYVDAQAALDWTLAWPDYGEIASRLSEEERDAFRARALEAVDACGDLSWEVSINYYAARRERTP